MVQGHIASLHSVTAKQLATHKLAPASAAALHKSWTWAMQRGCCMDEKLIQEEASPEAGNVCMEGFTVDIDLADAACCLSLEEWQVRQGLCERMKNGRPKTLDAAPVPPNNLGEGTKDQPGWGEG